MNSINLLDFYSFIVNIYKNKQARYLLFFLNLCDFYIFFLERINKLFKLVNLCVIFYYKIIIDSTSFTFNINDVDTPHRRVSNAAEIHYFLFNNIK